MQSGDVVLWKGRGIISRLIRIWSEYSHASLVLRLKEFENLKDRRFLLEALSSGIELRLLSRRLEEYSGEAWWFPLKSIYDRTGVRQEIATWALKQVGIKYDFDSLFRNALGRVSADAKQYFCSEFVYLAYKQAGLVKRQKAPRPGDIAKWKYLFQSEIRIL